jgi:transcriptional regulator with XRE-family HTH domain
MDNHPDQQLPAAGRLSNAAIAAAFDPARLTQARRLAGMTKKAVADELRVSSVAVGQWEAGSHPPRPDHIGGLAQSLAVPPAFFAAGLPYARLESSTAHFRSLRKTPAIQRAKAIAFTEQCGSWCTHWKSGFSCHLWIFPGSAPGR